MTPAEQQELKRCSQRIAQILFQEAQDHEQPLNSLGDIELTVRQQIQDHIAPTIGEFFANPSVAPKTDTHES